MENLWKSLKFNENSFNKLRKLWQSTKIFKSLKIHEILWKSLKKKPVQILELLGSFTCSVYSSTCSVYSFHLTRFPFPVCSFMSLPPWNTYKIHWVVCYIKREGCGGRDRSPSTPGRGPKVAQELPKSCQKLGSGFMSLPPWNTYKNHTFWGSPTAPKWFPN